MLPNLNSGDDDWADDEDPDLIDPTTAFHPKGCDCEGCREEDQTC